MLENCEQESQPISFQTRPMSSASFLGFVEGFKWLELDICFSWSSISALQQFCKEQLLLYQQCPERSWGFIYKLRKMWAKRKVPAHFPNYPLPQLGQCLDCGNPSLLQHRRQPPITPHCQLQCHCWSGKLPSLTTSTQKWKPLCCVSTKRNISLENELSNHFLRWDERGSRVFVRKLTLEDKYKNVLLHCGYGYMRGL